MADPNNLMPHFLYVIWPGFAFAAGFTVFDWVRRRIKGRE